ncbi:MAG: acyl-CoA dehydrogenase family protein, partial [Hyphomicrobium sp.]|nr:acyl-CoA dehydrogenase family protein [Hyphomicrobium sp.]
MDFTEPDHIRMLRETIRRFVADRMPRESAAKWDKENYFPRDVFLELADLGVIGLTFPEKYGGTGRDILATMVVIEELSKRSLAVSVPYIMASCYAGMNLLECGSEAQKKSLLPEVAAGRMMFAYGWTEPDVGGDVASVKTTAVRDGNELVVNGAKRFCSGAGICDYIFTVLRTGPADERRRNLSIVLIPPDARGISITPMEALGMKGAATTDVSFTDVRVPIENVLGGPEAINRGWSMITGSGLDVEKLEVAALALGIATAAFEDAWIYSEQRIQFGQPIAAYQSVRHKLADMKTQLHAAQLMMYHAAWLADRGVRCGVETSMTKLFVTETAKALSLEAQTILGAYGYVKDFDVERYVRDALLTPIIGGSSAIQRNNIANW